MPPENEVKPRTRTSLRARARPPLLVGCASLLLLVLMLHAFEHSQVYHPTPDAESTVSDVRGDGEDVFIEGADGSRRHAWFFPGSSAGARGGFVFLFCHGNGGNLTSRPGYYRAILSTGAGLLTFDYRGYGRSPGHPGEKSTYEDALVAYDWLRDRGVPAERIVPWGESLGGGIASKVAAERRVGGLVLQSTFTSIPDVGAELFPFLPVKLLATIHYPTRERLPEIHSPVVVMHSRDDELVPYAHGRANFDAAGGPKAFVELLGGHNDALLADERRYIAGAEKILELIESPTSE
jgi:fermentation-respiration switch protein FrsA (DUF1100 family)